jgi:two-component system OmpR family response regulator
MTVNADAGREAARPRLRFEGWEVAAAGDGATALRTARSFRPDAVVLDMMLPDMDGLEVLRRLPGTSPGHAGLG